MYDDGYCSADGSWWGFLQFVRHPNVVPWLAGCDLGSSEDEATHWLLCDLESREVYIGERAEVKTFLANEVKKYVPEETPANSRVEISPEEIGELLTRIREELQQVPVPSVAEIQGRMRRDQEAVEKMVAELGGRD